MTPEELTNETTMRSGRGLNNTAFPQVVYVRDYCGHDGGSLFDTIIIAVLYFTLGYLVARHFLAE